jgi:hypothetical protein
MIEYDGGQSRSKEWLKLEIINSGTKSYFDAFFISRDYVINNNLRFEFPTYESIQSFIVSMNFNRLSAEKLSATVLDTVLFNRKMKKIHGTSWKYWDPEEEYFNRFQKRN